MGGEGASSKGLLSPSPHPTSHHVFYPPPCLDIDAVNCPVPTFKEAECFGSLWTAVRVHQCFGATRGKHGDGEEHRGLGSDPRKHLISAPVGVMQAE